MRFEGFVDSFVADCRAPAVALHHPEFSTLPNAKLIKVFPLAEYLMTFFDAKIISDKTWIGLGVMQYGLEGSHRSAVKANASVLW
jgi:hypothetical protein